MKKIALAMLLLFVAVPGAFADAQAAPATQPTVDVVVLPFVPLGDQNTPAWVGRAVQQNLLADLAHGKFHPASATYAAADPQAAGKIAKAQGAKYAITGSYQSADQLVRFNGQIIEVATGSLVGGITATGALRDLFAMEDTLSQQALRELNQLNSLAAAAINAPPAAAQAPVPVNPPANLHPFQGSELESYANSNRTPSTDYWQQYNDSYDRQAYGYNPYTAYWSTYGSGIGYGSSYGGYGFGYAYPSYYPLRFSFRFGNGGNRFGIGSRGF